MTVHRAIFWLHLATGTLAGLVILVMAVTGVLLAFEPQIVDYAERDFRQVTPPAPDARKLSMDTILARAKAARPDARPTAVVSWSDPGSTVRVAFSRDDGVFVNPYTGELLGSGSKVHDAMHVIEDWHRWLGSRDVGRPYTGACNLAFLGLAISGLYLWWPRRWTRHVLRGSTLFDAEPARPGPRLELAQPIGFWCAPVLIVLTVTGAVMSYQWANDLLYRLTGNEPPPAPGTGPAGGRAERPRSTPGREPASVAALWARAEQQVPGWTSIFLRLPPTAGRPGHGIHPRAGAARAWSDPPLAPHPRSLHRRGREVGALRVRQRRAQAPHVVSLSPHGRGLRAGSGHRGPGVGRRACSCGRDSRWPGVASLRGMAAGRPPAEPRHGKGAAPVQNVEGSID